MNKLLKLEEERGNRSHNDEPTVSDSSSYNFPLNDGISHGMMLHHSRFIEVPHVNQLYNWDCGLACILMVLQTIGIDNCDLRALEKLCGTQSIWTVDLAYLLRSFSVMFTYFTVTLGANPNFSVETFYKDQLPHDLVRVDLLFQKAVQSGIKIEIL